MWVCVNVLINRTKPQMCYQASTLYNMLFVVINYMQLSISEMRVSKVFHGLVC